tara:strand:+ start:14 stop:478 length:465 start_codon:yes stop_codon:yes gene_type:complete
MKKFQKYRFLLPLAFTFVLVSIVQFSCSKKEQRNVITQRNMSLKNKSLSPLPVKLDKGNYDTSVLKTVCDCYEESLDVLEKVKVERTKYPTKKSFEKNKQSVKAVKELIKNWNTIRTFCLMTFMRKMYEENDCGYPVDIVNDKRDELYDLGLDT